MKTRWIVLLADGLLALALAFALLALASGKPARTGETFELPASPATAGVGRHGPIAAELSGGNLFHPLRGAAVPEGQKKAAVPDACPSSNGGKVRADRHLLIRRRARSRHCRRRAGGGSGRQKQGETETHLSRRRTGRGRIHRSGDRDGPCRPGPGK